MRNESPHKEAYSYFKSLFGLLIGLILIITFIVMVVIVSIEKKKVDDTLIELHDPIEPQEVRDFRK